MKPLKIGYFADGLWAHNALKMILEDSTFQVVFICVRFDHRDPVLIEIGNKNKIPVLWDKNINSNDFHRKVSEFGADIFVSMSFNQIFRKETFELPNLDTINCHAGKLPFYRGRNILNWALINDEKEFGITVHYIDAGIDTGDIIIQKTFPITDADTYATLLDTAHTECANILYEALKEIYDGSNDRIKQTSIHPVGLYCPTRITGDEILDWNQTSRDVFNFVRAICEPGPMARTFCGRQEIRINRVEEVPEAPIYKGIPGNVLSKNSDGSINIKTADSFVKVTEFYCDSKPPRVGARLKSQPESNP